MCKKVLPESHFNKDQKYCKICFRDYRWQNNYGLSPEQYLELYKQQEGKCLICGEKLPEDKYLCVDHNKETGEVRGLLCSNCNTGLGLFGEDIKRLERAKEYLISNDHSNN